MATNSRKAKLELSFKGQPGEKRERVPLGGVFQGRFPGSYDVSFSVPSEKDGWDKIVAVKTAEGRIIDITEAFVNLVVYEELEARPPFEESQAAAPAKKDFSEDF